MTWGNDGQWTAQPAPAAKPRVHPPGLPTDLGEPSGLTTFPQLYLDWKILLTDDPRLRHPIRVSRSEGPGGPMFLAAGWSLVFGKGGPFSLASDSKVRGRGANEG